MAPGAGPVGLLSPVRRKSRLSAEEATAYNEEVKNSAPLGAGSDDELAFRAAVELREFVIRKEGSALRAWCKHFDQDNDQKISLSEFLRAMRKLDYKGDATSLFNALDADRSGELALEEMDARAAEQWRHFKAWCVLMFEDIKDMVQRLGSPEQIEEKRGASLPKVLSGPQLKHVVTEQQFIEGVRSLGWTMGYEDILYSALNINDKPAINEDDLKWLEMEKRRQKRKDMAKKKALAENTKRNKDSNWKVAEALLADFKQFLKRSFGNYVRAWRSLSPDGTMVLQRSVLYKACTSMGWQGDVRLLYKAFDKDDSGYISIEELDARAAELFAYFHEFMNMKWGSASAAFRALDKYNQKKLKQPEFIAALKSFGFQHPAKPIFLGLDFRGYKTLVEEDVLFLDKWKPPAFLTRPVNVQAMEEVKLLMIKVYKTFLKAWRHCLDPDSSNRCNYDEFEVACKKLNFKGDVPGAWRALDEDLSGYITLHEIDSVSSGALADFRRWCDEEFGSVRSAFSVFDVSGDNEVTYREWRRSLRIYGFEGNASTLFFALDVEKIGSLSVDKVGFLDEWHFPDKEDGAESQEHPPTLADLGYKEHFSGHYTTQYETDSPGPAAYRLPSAFGAGPLAPMNHFGGAFSFAKRPVVNFLPGFNKDSALMPSPGDYDDQAGIMLVTPGKPSWAFGSERRHAVDSCMPEAAPGPGPGQYSPTISRGPSAAFTPRRALKVHPLFRELGHNSREASQSPRKFPRTDVNPDGWRALASLS